MNHMRQGHGQGSDRPAAVDRVLAEAAVPPGPFDGYNEQAALARIAGRVVWNRADAMDRRAQSIRHDHDRAGRGVPAAPPLGAARRTALHERAATELSSLSARVVHDRSAVAAMARLVDDPAIEPGGALAFACLLHLAGRHEGAAFWWRFAAGAGSATAARCLYLHHLEHSERQAAQWWLQQAAALYAQDGDRILGTPPTPIRGDRRPSRYGVVESSARFFWEEHEEREGGPDRPAGQGAPAAPSPDERWWRAVTARLTDAVGKLEAHSDADYGTVPRPAPYLAAKLEDCAGTPA
ncbi:hypothetical protein AB0G83_23995 [Streptomyces klenkii]|uniref:Sel1 repeat family protein n=1 Tax=Streptomyces klenkii TaxID=1420899 RepID=A0A3B0B6A0_9ACTN|nr:hypothetical protein [Streptomyces klenkii]RKN69915.1 hypothetical protein D7231_22985 [Streptomyces klenkii]